MNMKCVCGYHYIEELVLSEVTMKKENMVISGDEPFIKIVYPWAETSIKGNLIDKVYACPKCKTIRIN